MTQWQETKFEDIKAGDFVKYVVTSANKKTIVKGEIGAFDSSDTSWAIGSGEWAYSPQYSLECGEKAKYFRKVKPFAWPTKLGAVVTGKDEDGEYTIILVKLSHDGKADYHLWYSDEWGTVTASDLTGLEDLTVVSEGVTVEA